MNINCNYGGIRKFNVREVFSLVGRFSFSRREGWGFEDIVVEGGGRWSEKYCVWIRRGFGRGKYSGLSLDVDNDGVEAGGDLEWL